MTDHNNGENFFKWAEECEAATKHKLQTQLDINKEIERQKQIVRQTQSQIDEMEMHNENERQRKNDRNIRKRRNNSNQSHSSNENNTKKVSTFKREKQPPPEMETDPLILERRQKQIDYGKNTSGYFNYKQRVPVDQRTREDPKTPDKYQKYSRRSWDALIKYWRRKLHTYDDDVSTAQDNEEEL